MESTARYTGLVDDLARRVDPIGFTDHAAGQRPQIRDRIGKCKGTAREKEAAAATIILQSAFFNGCIASTLAALVLLL
jgi:hypothetical protein